MAIDREVFSCHPPKVEQQVRHIIGEFRKGTLDKVPIWMEKTEKPCWLPIWRCGMQQAHISETMELVQDMGFAKRAFPFRRKSKRSSAARRYGGLTYFCFSI